MKKLPFALISMLLISASSFSQQPVGRKGNFYTLSATCKPADSMQQGAKLVVYYFIQLDDGNAITDNVVMQLDQITIATKEHLKVDYGPGYSDSLIIDALDLPEGVYTFTMRYGGQSYSGKKLTILKNSVDSDAIWPGDANNDHSVDLYDPLAIAVAYGKTGPKRMFPSTVWQRQFCADWSNSFTDNVNYDHADCNGNGIIDNYDLYAVDANYTAPHQGGSAWQSNTPGLATLQFDLAGIVFAQGDTVTLPLKLGDKGTSMNNLYGIATNIQVLGAGPDNTPTLNYDNSWPGSSGNILTFTKARSASDIDCVLARTDHQNISGGGTIATMRFVIPKNVGNDEPIIFHLSNTKIIDKDGHVLSDYNVADDTAYINSAAVANAPDNDRAPVITPNPSNNGASLVFAFTKGGKLQMIITDLEGKTVSNEELSFAAGQHIAKLPNLAPGTYIVCLQNAEGSYKQTLKWIQR